MGVLMMAEKADDTRETMSVQDVADLLHVSKGKVYDLMLQGVLTSVDPPNPFLKRQKRRFRRADVERILSESRESPPSQSD